MGTGYTRNDTSNNIADGNIINAADLDGEFDAIESAFGTSGHTHDGTSAEGGPITVLGPVQDFVASATEIKPKTTNTLDIGTNSLLFKDLFLDGVATLGSIKIDNAGTIGSASDGDAIAISSGGVVTFSQAPLVDVTNATTNAVTDVLGIQVQSSGTPAVGIGSGLTLGVETASGNVETAGAIRIVSTGLTPTDEEIDLVFYSMRNGSLTEGFRYDSSADSLDVSGSLDVNSGAENTVATFTSTDTEAQINLVDSTGSAQIRSRNDLRFFTNGGSTRAMDITSTGDVGIGTSTPTFNSGTGLEVTRAGTASIRVERTDATASSGEFFAGNGQVVVNSISNTPLIFRTNNTNRMALDTSGNVGINTDSPTDELHIVGVTPAIKIEDTDGSYALISANADNLILGADEGNAGADSLIGFQVDGTEYMRLTSSGQLGIGTTPSSQLSLSEETSNTTTRSDQVRIEAQSTGTTGVGFGTNIFFVGERNGGTLQAMGRIGYAASTNTSSNLSSDFIVETAANGVSGERLRIDSSGNVGINTAPSRELEVTGSGNVYIRITAENSDDATGLELKNTGANWLIQNNDQSSDALTFTRDSTEAMRIDSTGDVIIGTTDKTLYDETSGGETGFALRSDGRLYNATDGNTSAIFNRLSSDGNIAQFRREGATVAQIGSRANVVGYIALDPRTSGVNGAGLTGGSVSSTVGEILPTDGSGAVDDDAVNLGDPSYRFKNMYLSGSITAGDRISADGSEAAPAFRFATDTNTGMFPPSGGDVIGFATGGSEAMRIDSNGRVGIGTTPLGAAGYTAQLEIGSTNGGMLILTDTNTTTDKKRHFIAHPSTSLKFGRLADDGSVTADDDMVINSNGEVGINHASPDTNLHVVRSSNGAQMPFIIGNEDVTASSTAQTVRMGFGLSRDSGTIKNDAAIIEARKDSAWTAADSNIDASLAFYTYTNNSPTEKLSIGSNGYLVAQSASQVRLVLGSTGNSNNNTSNWIRGNGSDLERNTPGQHRWEVNGTQVALLDGDGLRLGTDTAANQGLDDYAEGSFSPTISDGTTTENFDTAYYVKIGRAVIITGRLTNVPNHSSFTGTQEVRIGNLPYPSVGGFNGQPLSWRDPADASMYHVRSFELNSTTMFLKNDANTSMLFNDLQSNSDLFFSMCYYTSS